GGGDFAYQPLLHSGECDVAAHRRLPALARVLPDDDHGGVRRPYGRHGLRDAAGVLAGDVAAADEADLGVRPGLARAGWDGHGVVQPLGADAAGFQQLPAVVGVGGADHLHVGAGAEGEPGGVRGVGGDAVRDELLHAVVVADDEAVEAEVVVQDLGEGVPVGV